MKRAIYIGISQASAWAWGVSFLVTLSVVSERGAIPFWLWATFNSMAIPIFGMVIRKLPYLGQLTMRKKNPVIHTFLIIIQFFSIIVNVQAIYEAGLIARFPNHVAMLVAVGMGLGFVAVTYKNGLRVSMFNSQFQWTTVLIVLSVLVVMGLQNGDTKPVPLANSFDDVRWGLFAGVLLLGGPFVDLQNWQRARLAIYEKKYSAFWFAGLFFFLYMLGIFLFGHFPITKDMGMLVFVGVLMVSTATIDSNGAALQEIGKKGFWIGIGAVFAWYVLKDFGILALWSTLASFRLVLVIILLSIAIYVKITRRGLYGEETIYR